MTKIQISDLLFTLILANLAGYKLDEGFLRVISKSRRFERILRNAYLNNPRFRQASLRRHSLKRITSPL